MCGLAGLWSVNKAISEADLCAAAQRMNDAITHRGPDSEGLWNDSEQGIALAHRRLAILDLSPEGAQPMTSASGRYVMVYNGEFYSYKQHRQDLIAKGHHFRGHSDTEVILALCDEHGPEQTFTKLSGMFAIALWDRQDKMLYLVRDPLGKKPLYYTARNGALLFGSELRSLRASGYCDQRINRDALGLLMQHNYIHAPHTIYNGVHKLEAGTYLKLSEADITNARANPDHAVRYWDMVTLATNARTEGLRDIDVRDEPAVIDALDETLTAATARRMMSDVPLGAFLSGGVDSSLVVALMQKLSATPIQTFSIGFEEFGFDESPYAKAIAAHLGTSHTEHYVSAKESLDTVSALADIYDEPFADPSMLPTYHVCRMARRSVTVALSGDGGDEFFGGYSRYARFDKTLAQLSPIPAFMRKLAALCATGASSQIMQAALSPFARALPRRYGKMLSRGWLERCRQVFQAQGADALYAVFMSYTGQPGQFVQDYRPQPGPMARARNADLPEPVHKAMLSDAIAYLPEDILVKVDRASMASSLEVRAPLLDVDVIDFAWRLPLSMTYDSGNGKTALKAVLDRYVPRTMFARPKMGFGIPLADWLRGPLKEWAADLIASGHIGADDMMNAQTIRRLWEEHQTGAHDWSYQLWSVLMFCAWRQRWHG